MPIEFIPNQPVVFEKPIGDYPCLNNDPKAYGPLMRIGDEMCIQWKLTPCGTPLCEPDMYIEGNSVILNTWTAPGDWTQIGTPPYLTFNGGTDGTASNDLGALVAGTVYKLSFTVTAMSGLAVFIFKSSTGIVFGTINTATDAIGTYSFYFVADSNPFVLQIEADVEPSTVAELVMEDIAVQQWTQCWQDGLESSSAGWSYNFDPITQQGRFCSNNNLNGLINTNSFINTTNYHGVSFVISNCTAGGLAIYIDGGFTPIGTTSGNGKFTFYGIPNGNDLIFQKIDNFNGCISQVSINDYGLINDYEISFQNDLNTVTSNSNYLTVYDDRLVWCGTFGDFTWKYGGTPDMEPICGRYYTKIYDPCDDVTYTSVNLINYDPFGHDCSKMVEAWNDGYAFGFYFGDVNAPDFKLKQRLRVLAFNPVYRNSGEEYLYSSGQTVRSYAQSQKARTAWFDYCDEYCHDTIRTQLLSQKLTIEGVSFYYPTEDYEPEWNDRGQYNLAQSRVKLFHELSTFGSTCGIIANPFCPPTQQAAIITQVNLILNALDTTGFNLTNTSYIFFEVSINGTYTFSGGSTSVDLTISANRTNLLNDIIASLNSCYSTSFTGSISLSGAILTINCTAQINTVLPVKTWLMVLDDGTAKSIPITTTFQ